MSQVGLTTAILVLVAAVIGDQTEVRFQWKYLNYTWPSWRVYEEAILDGSYIKEHNSIGGIKPWKDQVYLSIPRYKNGVPATLVSVSKEDVISPLLTPYPNWEMQRIGDCSAMQSVQGVEIDPQGRMWVINSGRIEVSTEQPRSLCPSRLMIFDIENNGEVLLDYIFPESVVPFNSGFLSDLVLDHESGGFAYIADFDIDHPGIVVFSLREKYSWKVSHESLRINPSPSILSGGIAVSPSSDEKGQRLVYYSPPSSNDIFSLPTVVLKNSNTAHINLHLRSLGRKPTLNGGMVMSSSGKLYFGCLTEDAIGVWDKNSESFTDYQEIWAQNVECPDAFAIDEFGFLWNTAKRVSIIRDGIIDSSKLNFQIMQSFVDSKNYQYYKNGRAPVLPEITESSIFRILFKNFRVSLNHVRKRAFSLS